MLWQLGWQVYGLMSAPLWCHHNASDFLYLRIIRWTATIQVSGNLCSQIRDGHKLFEDILWKNVCVACLFDVIRRHIDVICTQMEIGC